MPIKIKQGNQTQMLSSVRRELESLVEETETDKVEIVEEPVNEDEVAYPSKDKKPKTKSRAKKPENKRKTKTLSKSTLKKYGGRHHKALTPEQIAAKEKAAKEKVAKKKRQEEAEEAVARMEQGLPPKKASTSEPKMTLPYVTKTQEKEYSKQELDDIALGEDNPDSLTDTELDFRRKQVHRLRLRGVPNKTICNHLKITYGTLMHDIKIINSWIREEVTNMDFPLMIGSSMAVFDEVRNIALRLATDSSQKDKSLQLRALSVVLQAETNKHNFLNMAGLYKGNTRLGDQFGNANSPDQFDDFGDFANFINAAVNN